MATPPNEAPASTGITSFMTDVMKGVETPGSPAAPSETKAETEVPDKPSSKPAEKPAVKSEVKPPAKQPDKPVPEKPRDDVAQLRKRKDELEAYEKRAKSEITKLQQDNKALAEKRYVTPEMQKEIDDNKAEMTRLKTHLAEAAYEYSDEYKARFVEPWQRTLQSTLAMVDQMATPVDEETGQSRKTTSADFQRVFSAPVGEQADVAHKLFGTNALRIIAQIDRLNELKQQAESAVKSQREGLDGKRKQFEEFQKQEHQKYSSLRDQSRAELVEKYPQFFAPDEADPEASEALASGFAFVDKAAEKAHELSPDERAAYAEVIRARAAWFPRGFKELSKAKEKISSLESELSKYRASDPGSDKDKGTVPVKKSEFGSGIQGLAEQIEREMQ